jgi:hypothetical protein
MTYPPGRPWPWLPNYLYARPETDPYAVDEVLPAFEPGWQDLISEGFALADATGAVIVQVKQKFGALRIYAGWGSHRGDWATGIERLEAASLVHCEICGALDAVTTATTPPRFQIQTLCERCRAQARDEQAAEAADPDRLRAHLQLSQERFASLVTALAHDTSRI